MMIMTLNDNDNICQLSMIKTMTMMVMTVMIFMRIIGNFVNNDKNNDDDDDNNYTIILSLI